MATGTPKILGPINEGSSFFIATYNPATLGFTGITGLTGNIPYVLTSGYDEGLTGSGYYYYWTYLNVDNPHADYSNIPVFSAVPFGEDTVYGLRDHVNKGGIGYNENNVVTNSYMTQKIYVTQTFGEVTRWWPPAIFLSDVAYSLFAHGASGAAPNLEFYLDETRQSTTAAIDLFFVPVTWFTNCDQSSTGDVIGQVSDGYKAWACMVNRQVSYDCPSQPSEGFTQLSDCQAGQFYNYCSENTGTGEHRCGDDNCNGPCKEIYYDCLLKNGQYTCVFDANKYFEDTAWYRSTWFILTLVGFFILLLLCVLGIVFFVIHEKKKKDAGQPNLISQAEYAFGNIFGGPPVGMEPSPQN